MDPAITTQLAAAGFDLVHAFDAHAIARTLPAWQSLADGPRVGVLLGNTRAVWAPFVAAMCDPDLAASIDPLDRYVEREIAAAVGTAPTFYSHQRYAIGGSPPSYLPFQPLAVAIGLGALAESHLVIHPTYGPWFALRAVILVDGEPPRTAPIAKPCICTKCPSALAAALAGGDWQAWVGVRSACSLDAHRYSDDQIRYHYLKVWRPPT